MKKDRYGLNKLAEQVRQVLPKILIANRGEIACRIIKSCREWNIKTVAIFHEDDRALPFVALADESFCLGQGELSQTYLCVEKILEIAIKTKVFAIHPGYGLLSENAEFAFEVEKKGLIFIGPTPENIRAMGDKAQSKKSLEGLSIPMVPSLKTSKNIESEKEEKEEFKKQALKIGLPVLLKASAGGGGKGMRIISQIEDFEESYDSCKREALKSFKDDRLLLEKYLLKARHLEVQVLSDTHQNHFHCFERECSYQRRHQKVIEESPASFLRQEIKNKLYQYATLITSHLNYRGAGTIEFVLDDQDNPYFLEMNTRLQVEHPVTEAVTGLDLVACQLIVASGLSLPFKQQDLVLEGYALEARIYSESPQEDFLPSIGTLIGLYFPKEQWPLCRLDSGVKLENKISLKYDPMIAKIISWGETREQATTRLRESLKEMAILGVSSNIAFCFQLLNHPEFFRRPDTAFLADYKDELLSQTSLTNFEKEEILKVLAILCWKEELQKKQEQVFFQTPLVASFFSNPVLYLEKTQISWQDVSSLALQILIEGEEGESFEGVHGGVWVRWGKEKSLFYKKLGNKLWFFYPTKGVFSFSLEFFLPPVKAKEGKDQGKGESFFVLSPMPGKILQLKVKKGERVEEGTPLLILEAMKMEHTLVSSVEGTIQECFFEEGEIVSAQVNLLEILRR